MNTKIKSKTLYLKMSSKYLLVIFCLAAVYIDHNGCSKTYKNKEISSAMHNLYIQLLHSRTLSSN